jgi:hypothetical protein
MRGREVVPCAPVRTAIGTHGGTLKDAPAVGMRTGGGQGIAPGLEAP